MRKTKCLGFASKMKIFVVSLGLLLCATTIYAQEQKYDMIIKTDGTKIEAKVLYIEMDVVKYKKINNLDGPSYSLSQDDIATILYANGTVDVFQKKGPASIPYQESIQSERKTCDELQGDYMRAQKLSHTGGCLLAGGFVLLAAGGTCLILGLLGDVAYGASVGLIVGGYVGLGIGWNLILPGAICAGIGNGRQKRIINEMNEICNVSLNRGGKYPVHLSFAVNGLALRF